jgi:Fic family protein
MMDGLIRAGIAHLYFVTIHPFEDGNGRIARVLTDMALAQDEKMEKRFYSLSTQIMAERNKYYDILESSQKGGLDITDWLVWFLQCTERAINNAEKIISKVLAKAEFWKKYAGVEINSRQHKVINTLLDAGPGGFVGGLTTRKYVSIAKTSRVTAYREIVDLLDKGLIKSNEGRGRNVSYDISWLP